MFAGIWSRSLCAASEQPRYTSNQTSSAYTSDFANSYSFLITTADAADAQEGYIGNDEDWLSSTNYQICDSD